MTVEEKIQSILSGTSGVNSIVPGSRIKVGFAGQGVELPYISHFPVAVEMTQTHSGLATLKQWRSYQVSCFAQTYSGAKLLATAVRNALADYRTGGIQVQCRGERPDIFEDDINVHQIPVEFYIADSL